MSTSSTLPGPDYVDFDQYIDIQLRKTRSTIKSTDVLTAVVGVLTLITLYLFLFVVCDHWLVPGGVSTLTRGILLTLVVAVTCGWLGWKVVLPWRRRVSGLYAASTIEKASPGLKSGLLNLVDLTSSGREVRPEIQASLERRAALALSHVDVNETVDRRDLLRLSVSLLVVVVLFCLYWIFSPKNPASSLWRALIPTTRASVATRTEIYPVRPGDADVIVRSQLEVTADLHGEIPPQVWLYYTTADEKFVDERIEMRLVDESSKQFRCVMNGENGGGILQNTAYRIVAGDAISGPYRIHVIQPPSATIDSIRLEFPGYTRRNPITQTTPPIDALEGTRVTLNATANMPIKPGARLQFFDDPAASKRGEEIPVRVTDGTKLQAQWKLELRSDKTSPHFYRIFCTNTNGESDPSPSLYSFTIRPDLPPEVVIRDPKSDLELPANAVLPVVVEARDPDFALNYVRIKIEKNGSPILGPEIFEGSQQEFKKTFQWKLKEYQLHPNDTITFWAQAQDNRQPIANTSNTPKLNIRITKPVSEEQVKKDLADAQQRQKQELANDKERAADSNDQEQNTSDEKSRAESEKKQGEQRSKSQQAAKGANEKDSQPKAQRNEASDQPGDTNQQPGAEQHQNQAPDKESDSGATKAQRQKLDPNDSADDHKALEELIKQENAAKEQNKGKGEGKGSKPSDDKGSAGQDPKSAKPEKNNKENKEANPDSKEARDEKKGGTESQQRGDAKENGQSKDSAHPGEKPKENEKPENRAETGNKGDQKRQEQPKDGAGTKAQPQPDAKGEKNADKPNSKGEQTGRFPGQKPGDANRESTADKPGNNSNPSQPKNGAEQGNKSPRPNPDGSTTPKPEKNNQNHQGDAQRPDDAHQSPQDGKPDESHRPDPSRKDAPNEQAKDQTPGANKDHGAKQEPDPKRDSKAPGKGADDQQRNSQQDANRPGKQEENRSDLKNSSGAKDGAESPQKNRDHQPNAHDAPPSDTHRGTPEEKPTGKPSGESKEKGSQQDAVNKTRSTEDKPPKGQSSHQEENGDRRDSKSPNESASSTQPDRKNKEELKNRERPTVPADGNPNDDHPKVEDRRHKLQNPDSKRLNSAPTEDAREKADAENANSAQQRSEQSAAQQQQSGANSKSQGEKGQPSAKGGAPKPGQQQKAQGQQGAKSDSKNETGESRQGSDGQPGKNSQQGKSNGSNQSSQQSSASSNTGGKESKSDGSKGSFGKGEHRGNEGGGHNDGTGSGTGEALNDTNKDANLDYAKKATDLVLDKLDKQLKRGEVDEKTLKALGWDKEQVRRFVERMRRQARSAEQPTTPADEARRLQYLETLRSLDLSPGQRRSSKNLSRSGASEIEGTHSTPPAEYRELYDAFTRGLAK